MLDEGSARGLILVSASAGFGKTTALADWIALRSLKAAWVTLDPSDADPVSLLAYVAAALRSIGAPGMPDPDALLGSALGPSADSILAEILEACDAIAEPFLLALDDWHSANSPETDRLLSLLVARRPASMGLVVSTRADPDLPLARLRSQGLLSEIRTSDLRFTEEESAEFLRGASGGRISGEEAKLVDGRVEGWAAGLRLTAIAFRGKTGPGGPAGRDGLIPSLARSGRFVLDYLFEEVFAQQDPWIRDFLLRTSILERMSGPLCDALLGSGAARDGRQDARDGRQDGRKAIEFLERANLFIIPLDEEGQWYRYHHLFSELLRQRLEREAPDAIGGDSIAELHRRAAAWFESAASGVEAFLHATAADDVETALRLLDGPLMGLRSRAAANAAIEWLSTIPGEKMDREPALWVWRATAVLASGKTKGVEESLRAAEAALSGSPRYPGARNIGGRISMARATLALTRYDAQGVIEHSSAALAALDPGEHSQRSTASWLLGTVYQELGRLDEAVRVFDDALAESRSAGNVFSEILIVIGLGEIRESRGDLHGALGSYDECIALAGEHPLPSSCEAHLGKARVLYEWNRLDEAEESARRALSLAKAYEAGIDRFIPCELLLARIELARGRTASAWAALEKVEETARSRGFARRLPEIAAAKVAAAIARGKNEAALRYAKESGHARLEARALIACGQAGAALVAIEAWLAILEGTGSAEERLKSAIVHAMALGDARREEDALSVLEEAMFRAEPSGAVRCFADSGGRMESLIEALAAKGPLPDHAARVLAACRRDSDSRPVEALSPREREVLALIAQGLSNQEIGERLFLALDSVKGNNRRIFEKLGVQRRTEAVAKARELGLI